MSLCSFCNNLLDKITDVDKLIFKCGACGAEFKASDDDTLLYHKETNISFEIHKSGKTIFNYPSNPKEFKECPECKAEIVGWELDYKKAKNYGCNCGHSWFEN